MPEHRVNFIGSNMQAISEQEKIRNIRLKCHQLAEPQFERPEDLVEWMGAVQAQDYTMVKWAVGMRLKSATAASFHQALEKGAIVRTHVLRPTWHLVAGRDIRWMLQLTAPRVKKTVDAWVKGSGLEIPEKLYTACNDLIGKMLSGHRCLTREEIGLELQKAGIAVDNDRIRPYLLRAETEGIVCSGADKEGKPSYALLEEHIAPAPKLYPDEALGRLALQYFRSHSPATLNDFVWWSGLPVREARKAVHSIGDRLVRECIDTQEFFIFERCREIKSPNLFHFMPPYDEYLISYKERSAVISTEHQAKAFNKWGIFYPVILYRGRVVGNWNRSVKKGKISVRASFFEPDVEKDPEGLAAAENKYSSFIG